MSVSTFKYSAYSSSGDLVEGEIEAKNCGEAEEVIFDRGLTPFDMREASSMTTKLRLSFGPGGPTTAQIAGFTREFATLEQANIPLDQSLRILAAQSAEPILRDLALEILARVLEGASLSEALLRKGSVFSAEYVNVVREGEMMGRLGPALLDLADMLERRIELRARIQSALIYPALLIALTLVSTGIVVGTLVPNIAPVFVDNGKDIPAGLRVIIDAEAHIGDLGFALVASLVLVLFIYNMAQARPSWRIAFARLTFRLPTIGGLIAQFATARFARTLGSMITAGVPLLQALESARAGVANAFLNHELERVVESVRCGATLGSALALVPYLPPVATQMITIGEETAQLGDMLLRVAAMFERQTQRSIERSMGLLTPALTIFIAAIVGGLIMTVMDAVLSINDLAVK